MSNSPHLEYVMEGSRRELLRFVEALKLAGISGFIRPKSDCAPTA